MPNNFTPRRPKSLTETTQSQSTVELVDPMFLLKAIGGVLAVALILAYATKLTVYSLTQWQLVLHPSRVAGRTPAQAGLPATEVHFGTDSSGEPQLDGWWIAADGSSTTPAATTALLLHDGSGTLSDALPAAIALNNANLNVLLFDYRGFGQSGGKHPTQASMQEDAETALNHILSAYHASTGGLVVYGIGLGGPLAIHLAAQHSEIPAIILQDPDGDLRGRVAKDVRSQLVPVGLLFHEDFALAVPLGQLATPKLLIAHTNGSPPAVFRQAAMPKMTVELPVADEAGLDRTLSRFLDSYVPKRPEMLMPTR